MKKRKQIKLDNIQFKKTKLNSVSCAGDFLHLQSKKQTNSGATLFSRGKISQRFFTEDSKLYITPREQKMLEEGKELNRKNRQWDAINSRIVRNYLAERKIENAGHDWLFEALEKRVAKFNQDFSDASTSFLSQFSMTRVWNVSIVGAILVGMFSMSLIYRYLGQGAAAGVATSNSPSPTQLVLVGQADAQNVDGQEAELASLSDEQLSQKEFEAKVRTMVKGYPIEKMLPYILKKDRNVAAYLIAIAKKESSWGVHSPVLKGQDCYNYWGYRGQRKLMGSGGHTCFNSRQDAVDTVGKRLDNLVNEQQIDNTKDLVVWKCGRSCAATGGQASANKWISDVDMYYQKLNGEEKSQSKKD